MQNYFSDHLLYIFVGQKIFRRFSVNKRLPTRREIRKKKQKTARQSVFACLDKSAALLASLATDFSPVFSV